MPQKQQQQKAGKKTGTATSSHSKPARARYKASTRATDRSIRNLMHHSNLTREQASDVVLRGAPIPSVKRTTPEQDFERYKRQTSRKAQVVQEGIAPVGVRLLGVPIPLAAVQRLDVVVEQNEDAAREYDNELSAGSSEDEISLAATDVFDGNAGLDSAQECAGLCTEFEHEQRTVGDAVIVADLLDEPEPDSFVLTREDVYEARVEAGMKPELAG